jgi:phosphatidylglycerophosphate synthase
MQAFSPMRKADDSNSESGRRLRRLDPSVIPLVLSVVIMATVVQWAFSIDAPYAAVASTAFIAGAALVLRQALRHLGGFALGTANRVTLARAALTALAAGLVLAEPRAASAWLAASLVLLALVLDGVDGALARRRGLSTAFGARFDMEIDAVTILVMTVLVWHFGKAGAWVLLGGLLRYGFVAAGAVRPWLRRSLPPSRRRQAACVVQIAALVACLVPLVPAPLAAGIAAAALATLVGSFAMDVAWLRRRARAGHDGRQPAAQPERSSRPAAFEAPLAAAEGGASSGVAAPAGAFPGGAAGS